MEPSRTQNAFEGENSPYKFLSSPLDFRKSLNFHHNKLNLSDTLHSLLITSDSTPKHEPNIIGAASCFLLNETKDDDFMLDPSENLKQEHDTPHEEKNLDIVFESNYMKHEEYGLDCYRIRRSRVPSFNISRDRKGSEDLFCAESDFKQLFGSVNILKMRKM